VWHERGTTGDDGTAHGHFQYPKKITTETVVFAVLTVLHAAEWCCYSVGGGGGVGALLLAGGRWRPGVEGVEEGWRVVYYVTAYTFS